MTLNLEDLENEGRGTAIVWGHRDEELFVLTSHLELNFVLGLVFPPEVVLHHEVCVQVVLHGAGYDQEEVRFVGLQQKDSGYYKWPTS